MKKFLFVLIALLLVAPAVADVVITCAQNGSEPEAIVYYDATTETELPRAFALDITISAGTIDALVDHNGMFWVHPGSIVIDGNSVSQEGTPIAVQDGNYPGREEGGLGTDGITIEMGSLYDPCDATYQDPPPASGTLLTFSVTADCTVTIAGNAARGGVVLEDPDADPTVTYSTCAIITECYTGPDYDDWVAIGKPSCWCNPRQCYGDAADDLAGDPKNGYWYVGATDLSILQNAWKVKEPATAPTPSGPGIASITDGECADIAHDLAGDPKNGYWFVGATDLSILTTYWKVKEPATAPTPSGPGIPSDCLD